MSNFFKTKKVDMFPSAYRKIETKGKYTSEENFVNIINSIVDYDRYVLSTEDSFPREPLKVVLHGYYFEIEDFSLNTYPNLWVGIKVEQGANALVDFDTSSTTIDENVDNGNFKGLAYTTDVNGFNVSDTTNYKYYTLQVSSGGSLVNQVKFSSNSIYYKGDKTRSVSSLLDEKQNKLAAGNGIDSNKLNNNEIALTDKFNSTLNSFFPNPSGVGSATQPVYVSTSGTMTALSSSSGVPQTNGSSNNVAYKYTQAALITNGNLMSGDTSGGVAFYASEGNPQSNVGKNGDFWFKYTA